MSESNSDLNTEKISNYTHFLVLPLKIVGCWDWYPKPEKDYQIFINNIYLCMVLFVLSSLPITLLVNLYTEWIDIMGSLEKIADGLPLLVSVAIVAYFGTHKEDLYKLVEYMDRNFKYHSARGLTNMTMRQSYNKAKNFAYVYTACTLFSVTMYVMLPVIVHFWTQAPLQSWGYMDVTRRPSFAVAFLQQAVGQAFVGLAVGQLGVFFAANAILLCGQYDLLCCSLRNARHAAALRRGVTHAALAAAGAGMRLDEKHNYIYSKAEMADSDYHFDWKQVDRFMNKTSQFDLYSSELDPATCGVLCDCARVLQAAAEYKQRFERFVSPLLALRVVQVTLYLCTLLYAATLKFDMITVEYLGAVALDIFVYCYFGNQIILQAARVSTAAYQSAWPAMGPRPRRLLLNLLLATKRPVVVRAGRFLPMDLHTFVVIIKTSFSYYTLLVNVNEKK